MKKEYIVPFSGGLDSTYLIFNLLEQGHTVKALYIEITNNTKKTEHELKAIEYLNETFFNNDPNYSFQKTGYVNVYHGYDCPVELQMIPIFINQIIYYLRSGARNNIAFGYCMNDDFASYMTDFKKILRSYESILHEGTKINIEFPVIKMHKSLIINGLEEYEKRKGQDIIKHCWFCECDGDQCSGSCIPTKRLMYDLDESFEFIQNKFNLGIVNEPMNNAEEKEIEPKIIDTQLEKY